MPRPRDPEVGQAIDEATIRLLAQRGLAGVTVEGVAAEAGVARTTVYRRYDGIGDMVAAAVERSLPLLEPPEAANDRHAWRQVVESLRAAVFETSGGLPLLAALLVAKEDEPELLDLWRAQVVAGRVEMVAHRFGWSPPRARQLAELGLGGLVAGFISRGDVTEERARQLADLLWEGLVRS